MLFAGLAPAAISFVAGQAAFTLALLVLFNLLVPVGWKLGLVRIEDVAIGGAVSLAVGMLFWPRGATNELSRALGSAYVDSSGYLAEAVAHAVACCDSDSTRAARRPASSALQGCRIGAAPRRHLPRLPRRARREDGPARRGHGAGHRRGRAAARGGCGAGSLER